MSSTDSRSGSAVSGDRIRLYDSHAHLISDDPVRYPFNPIPRDPSQPRALPPGAGGRPGGMHGPDAINLKPTAEQMHGWMAEENVVGMAAVQKGRLYGTDNSYIVDAADLFPDEMRAIVIVDPQAPGNSADGARSCQARDHRHPLLRRQREGQGQLAEHAGGFGGLGVSGRTGRPRRCRGAGGRWSDPDPGDRGDGDRFPNLRIVLDHIFLPTVTDPDFGIGEQFRGLASRDNVSVKFTSLNMDAIREMGVRPEDVLRRAVDFFGADKVMWGSDIGTSSGTYKEMVQRAIASTALLTAEERRKVLHDTGRRILLG
jgi:L-fuconolactonase